MNWIELSTWVECPHCGDDNHEHFEFDTLKGDNGGINGDFRELDCFNCCKKYWAKPYVSFEIDYDVWEKRPKGASGE